MAQAKKKKKFFDVDMPLLKKQTQLYAYKIEDINNRIIKYDLTRILKGKSSLINLKVQTDKEKSEATSYPIEFRILPQFTKRMIRKGTDYIEDSFKTECKDATIILKPFLITRRRVHRRVRKALREKTRQEIQDYSKNKTSKQLFEDILKNKLQKELGTKLKKVYPLSLCEIRIIKVDNFKENPEKETEKKQTEKETEKTEEKNTNKEPIEKVTKKEASKKTTKKETEKSSEETKESEKKE